MAFRFQDWQVYKDTRLLRKEFKEKIVVKIPPSERFEIVSQLNRALSSVALNIAEGSYRRTDKDFVHFLNQALTSLYEVVSILDLLYDDGYITKEERVHFMDKAENIAKQLSSFINSLKNKQ